MKCGGVGEALGSQLLERDFSGRYFITAVDGEFVSHASISRLMEKYSLSAEKMAEKIEKEVAL